MKVSVTEEQVTITEITQVTENECGVHECEFVLPECFDGLSVNAVFNCTVVPVVDNKCYIPAMESGNCLLGVYAYLENEGKAEQLYSPTPTVFFVEKGSYTEAVAEAEAPQISELDLFCERLKAYWADIIASNTLPDFTDSATEQQYYSAKVLNEMYYDIKGDIEEISAIVGGEV